MAWFVKHLPHPIEDLSLDLHLGVCLESEHWEVCGGGEDRGSLETHRHLVSLVFVAKFQANE